MAGDGPSQVLVLLPGLLCDDDLWRDQVSALRDEVTCQVADLTGHATIGELSASVLARAPERFALAGFSFGGYVAQDIVRQAPQRIERLALLDTSIRADTPERAAARKAMMQAARLPGAFKGITDRLLSSFVHPDRLSDAVLVERITSMTLRLGRDVFLRQSAMERLDGEVALLALKCPIEVICGDRDALTPLADHRELAEMLPNARLNVIAHSGHMTPMEQPDAVSTALRAWLHQKT